MSAQDDASFPPEENVEAKGTTPAPKPSCARRFFTWTIGLLLRLTIWYAIIAALFYCPSPTATTTTDPSTLDDTKIRICAPYFRAHAYLHPHASALYNHYAAPYVDVLTPYTDHLHTTIYEPARAWSAKQYHAYGDPHVRRALTYSKSEWDRRGAPKARELKDSLLGKYNAHKDKLAVPAQQVMQASTPYRQTAATVHSQARHHANYIYAFYLDKYTHFLRPRLESACAATRSYATDLRARAAPLAAHVRAATLEFLNETLRPRVAGLYSQTVEPQLVRIGKKLASYREGRIRGSNVTADGVTLSSTYGHETGTTGTATGTAEAVPAATQYAASSVVMSASPSASAAAEGPEKPAVKNASADLTEWETRFSTAIDRATADLHARITEIVTANADATALSHARSLLAELRDTVGSQIDGVKATTLDLVAATVPRDPEDSGPDANPNPAVPLDKATALSDLDAAVKSAGATMKASAHALREYASTLDATLLSAVTAATDSTLDVLGEIRAMGLEQIGVRWAWAGDDVSYGDWARYHALKKEGQDEGNGKVSGWKRTVRDLAILHKGLVEARTNVGDVLEAGMKVAEEAAGELGRVQRVGAWKIVRGDGSGVFEGEEVGEVEMSDLRAEVGGEETLDAQAQAQAGQKPLNGDVDVDMDAVLRDEKARDHTDFVERNPDVVASAASSTLTSALDAATASLSSALEHASASASVPASGNDNGGNPVILDSHRRYHEALALAHDAFSASLHGPNDKDNSAVPAPTVTPTQPADLEQARKEHASITSLLAASLSAVEYSVSSEVAAGKTGSGKGDPEETGRVLEEARERFRGAMGEAGRRLGEVEKRVGEVTETRTGGGEETGEEEPVYTILPVSEDSF